MHGEAHHVCHRCGWTFPNAHPSAKHRRAHKKVCGKLEGFKVIEHENDTRLAVSDDEYLSDENRHKETSNNVKGNGEIGRQVSNKSEEEEFSDAITDFVDSGTTSKIYFVEGSTASDSMIQPSKDPLDDSKIQSQQASENVEDQMVSDTNQDHTSSSAVHSMVPAYVYPENTQTGDGAIDMQANDICRENYTDGTLSAGKIAIEASEEEANLQKINGFTGGESSLDVTGDSKEEETSALEQKLSQDEISPSNAEGSNVKAVTESLPVLTEKPPMRVEQLSEMRVEDSKDHECLKSEPDLIPDCSEKRDTELHPKSSEGGESADFIVASVQVLEENLQKEEDSCKIMVEEVLAVGQADVAKDSLESDELEALPVSTISVLTSSQAEKDQIVSSLEVQEPLYQPQDESSETHLVVAAGKDTNVPPSNVVTNDATDAIISDQAVVLEEARADNSDITVAYAGGAVEENFTKTTTESKAVAECLSKNMTEPLSDATVCPDEEFQEGSKELKVNRSAVLSSTGESEVQAEPIDADSIITKPLHEETELNYSGDIGSIQSSAENLKIEGSMLSALDSGSHLLRSGKVEDNKAKSFTGDPDAHSQSLQKEKENDSVKQLSDTSAIAPPDSSVDSVSQADSVDGNWGSVSDGTAISLKDASGLLGSDNVAPKVEKTVSENTRGANADHRSGSSDIFEAPSFMTLVEPGKEGDIKSASPETQTAQNPQQVQQFSQAGWFPSITQVVNESQGRKRNEEIIEKVTSWNSGKSHTPLKSLLVEANIESKQKVKTIESNPTATRKIDASTAQDRDDLSAKTAHRTAAVEVTTKSNEEKEWDSPARLPVAMTREKRKTKHWIPFMCCSSVN